MQFKFFSILQISFEDIWKWLKASSTSIPNEKSGLQTMVVKEVFHYLSLINATIKYRDTNMVDRKEKKLKLEISYKNVGYLPMHFFLNSSWSNFLSLHIVSY